MPVSPEDKSLRFGFPPQEATRAVEMADVLTTAAGTLNAGPTVYLRHFLCFSS